MKTIYLVRHCEYANPDNIYPGRLPLPLSEIGRKRAEKLREYFLDKNISKIYSSSVIRCKETTAVISQGLIPVEYDVRLVETLSAYQGYKVTGDLGGDEIWKEYHSHRKELGGEGYMDIYNRAVSFFKEVAAKDEGNIIVSSHDDVLYTIYGFCINLPLPNTYDEEFQLIYTHPVSPKGSIRPVVVEDGTSFKPQELVVLEV